MNDRAESVRSGMGYEQNEVHVKVVDDRVSVGTSSGEAVPTCVVKKDPLRMATIQVFQSWLSQKGKITRRGELEVLGQHLFEMLFSDYDVKSFIVRKLLDAKTNKRPLRIQLSFERSDLASLPWEYLHFAPSSGDAFFLAMESELVLSRLIELQQVRERLKPDDSRLRLLLIVSEPSDEDLGPVLAREVIEEVEKLQHLMDITALNQPTPRSLLKALEESRPHVVHFIGHGRYKTGLKPGEEKQGEIALIGPDERTALWCSDKVFAEYFTRSRRSPVPRLVVLHVCEGGKVELGASFTGLAPQLILSGVQAVVAMQHPITNKHAIAFSRGFYEALAEGNPVDQAAQSARYAITLDDPTSWDNRVFGTPVLYMRSYDGIIVAAEDTPMAARPERFAAARQSPRPSAPAASQTAVAAVSEDAFVRPDSENSARRSVFEGTTRTSNETRTS